MSLLTTLDTPEVATSSLSWSAYDGSNNGTPTNVSSIINRSGWMVSMSDTQIMYVSNEDATNPDFVSRIITRSGSDISIGDRTSLIADMATGLYGQARVVKLSETRYLTLGCDTSDGSPGKFFLLDETGAQVATSNLPGEVINSIGFSIAVHSATSVAVAYSDTTGDDLHVVAIDLTGDTFSYGTPVVFSTTVTDYPEIVALTSGVGHIAHENLLYRYTISGTTITAGNSTKLDAAKTNTQNDGGRGICRIDDTHSLVTYVETTTNYLRTVVITDAATPSAGSITTLDTDPARKTWARNMVDVSGNGTQFFTAWTRNTATLYAKSTTVYVDPDTYAVTQGSVVNVSNTDVFADHTVCANFGTSGYGLVIWQDDGTSNELGYCVVGGNG